MTRLDLRVRLEPSQHRLYAQAHMVLRRTGQEPTDRLKLAFARPHGEFVGVTSSTGAAALSADKQRLEIRIPRPTAPGSEVEVEFTFRSLPRSLPVPDSFAVSDQSVVANAGDRWYPFPEDGSFEAPGRLEVEMPRHWKAVATGQAAEPVAEPQQRGRKVLAWKVTRPAGRSFAAGPFSWRRLQRGGLTIELFYPPEEVADPSDTVASMAVMLMPLEKRFGSFPWNPFQVVLLPASTTSLGGAPAEQMFAASAGALKAPKIFELVFAHESAHAWWWFQVRPEEDAPLLLSESLAQYGYVISLEERAGKAAALSFLNDGLPGLRFASARGYAEMWKQGRDRPLAEVAGGTPGDDNFRLAWIKGAWFLHMLRDFVGDQAFFQALGRILEEFQDRKLTLEDFQRHFQLASQDRAVLNRFWDQWLRRRGMPVLQADWNPEPREGAGCSAVIRQEADPYLLDLEIEIRSASGSRITERRIGDRSGEITFSCPAEPFEIRLDPRGRLLIWRPEWGPAPLGNAR